MRLPSLPIYVDEFPALRTREWHSSPPTVHLFLLSHFHTDHMRGLHSTWDTGVIITSTITKQLLLSKYDNLRRRVFALPFWCRTPLLLTAAAAGGEESEDGASGSEERTSAVSTVHITLLPAFHIPGSAMFFFEMPSGVTSLYTGDFKFTHATASPLHSFLQSHRVDHVYIDDTWLHLGQVEVARGLPWERASATGGRAAFSAWHDGDGEDGGGQRGSDGSGLRVVSKLLNAEQVAEAVEAIGRRMDHQRQLCKDWQRAHLEERTAVSRDSDDHVNTNNRKGAVGEGSAPPVTRQPFIVRVYLHNQFGKELLVQQLAERLHTRAIIDDARYTRLLTVVEALEEERDDLQAFAEAAHPSSANDASKKRTVSPTTATGAPKDLPPLSPEEQVWRAAGGEASQYPYDLNYFVSASQAAALRASPRRPATPSTVDNPTARSSPRVVAEEMPCVEVVSTRAEISPEALQQASVARGGTPHYGVLISGWARLQTHNGSNDSHQHNTSASLSSSGGQVWHIPTTLHNTPQELMDFVALLRPLSVTPLHYRPSRAAVVLQRLGPFLRTPFVNLQDTGYVRVADVGGGDDGGEAEPTLYGAPRWQLFLPLHVLRQNSSAAAEAERASMQSDRDGLEALVAPSRPGYHLRPPSETGVLDDLPGAVSSSPMPTSLPACAFCASTTAVCSADARVAAHTKADFGTAAASCSPVAQEVAVRASRLCRFTDVSWNVQEWDRKRERAENSESAAQLHRSTPSLSDIADDLL